MSNPNWPQNLNINPSVPSSSLESTVSRIYGYDSQKQAIEQYGIAGRVWEAAYILNVYINPPQNLTFDPPFHKCNQNRRIIELGSGSGMIGMNIARSLTPDRDVLVLTDLEEVCPLLERNLALEDHILRESIHVCPLAWGNSQDAHRILHDVSKESIPLTHIICSDLVSLELNHLDGGNSGAFQVYFPDLLAPLLRTLIELSSPPFADPDLKVVISYKIRSLSKETPFWSAFGLWFTFEPVLVCETTADKSAPRERFGSTFEGPMFIFIARRRPESLGWTVPRRDEYLLAGFGAYGKMQPRADETFESLLFMSMADCIES
ncbi:putative methyltransferase-domain-containing protein [Rhodocollybia butyracea]|uniref:Methyltransferase-domain-containing protein n=1 Tax=Rhodocollybia butyracea TaxID=206335 RepID=A0A9P5PS07_9AGAR|nr:putative methyltransferase-domain-containing protein [Rhodocollybia butyracea]